MLKGIKAGATPWSPGASLHRNDEEAACYDIEKIIRDISRFYAEPVQGLTQSIASWQRQPFQQCGPTPKNMR